MDTQTENANLPQGGRGKKREKKSLFRSAVSLYIAVAILALAVSFGWFTMNANVFLENETAGNMQIAVSAGDLSISLDPTTGFGSEINVDKQTTSYFIDVTGDGMDLYFPQKLDEHDLPLFNQPNTFLNVSGNADYYLEMRVYFRTSTKMDIYLSDSSEVRGLEDYLNSDLVRSFSRPSDKYGQGKFSLDAIVGAARVAFLEEISDGEGNTTLELKNVWIPNDNLCLSYGADGVASLTNDSQNRESLTGYHYLRRSADNTYMETVTYAPDDYAYGRVTVGAGQLATSATETSNQAVPLLSFVGGGVLETKTMIIRIWFEGTDREADKALNGGMAQYCLNFIGLNKEASDVGLIGSADLTPGTSLEEGQVGIYYNTKLKTLCYYNSETYETAEASPVSDHYLLYSTDGIEWQGYTSTVSFASGTTVYVRTAEDGKVKPGNIVKVLVP